MKPSALLLAFSLAVASSLAAECPPNIIEYAKKEDAEWIRKCRRSGLKIKDFELSYDKYGSAEAKTKMCKSQGCIDAVIKTFKRYTSTATTCYRIIELARLYSEFREFCKLNNVTLNYFNGDSLAPAARVSAAAVSLAVAAVVLAQV